MPEVWYLEEDVDISFHHHIHIGTEIMICVGLIGCQFI
jgi:hypothetical protein